MGGIRRSVLFMPADSLRKITKATTLDVDCIVMDLEDGVALNRKEEGRTTAIEACETLDFGQRECLIRINSPRTFMAPDDLQAVRQARPDGVVIPKVESAEDLKQVDDFLTQAEREEGWPEGGIKLHALIESARGVLFLPQIVVASTRLATLMFGAEDLAGDMGAIRTPQGTEIFYARSAVVTAAAAFGLDALDMIYTDFKDMDGLATESQQARQLGYTGKMAIHPKQVAVINEVFSPSPEEIAAATELIAAHEEHQAAGTGAFAFHGKMVDMPMIRAAESVIDKARAAGLLEND